MGEPKAKNLATSKSNEAKSTESTDSDSVSKLKVCLRELCFDTSGDAEDGRYSGSVGDLLTSQTSRIFPLLRLRRSDLEVSKLLMTGGRCELILRVLLVEASLLSIMGVARHVCGTETLEALELETMLCALLREKLFIVQRASYASRAPMQSPSNVTWKPETIECQSDDVTKIIFLGFIRFFGTTHLKKVHTQNIGSLVH